MGLHFRKSIRVGKGGRVNLSKNGVGFSFGFGGLRWRYSPKRKSRKSGGTVSVKEPTFSKTLKSKKSKTLALVLCIFLGFFGVHRFYVGKIGSGILYAFTAGVFMIGWIVDIVNICRNRFTDGSGCLIC